MNGFELAQQLRAQHYPHPIIAISGNDTQETRKKCRNVGINAFLPKPIQLDDLEHTVLKWL
jgi:CheY-like chemotaxis protein